MSTFEGGLCLNLRYFVPTLPLLAILCAYAIRNLREEWQVSFSLPVTVASGLATMALYLLLVERFKSNASDLVFPLLIFPLLIAFFLACLILIRVSKAQKLFPVDKALAVLVAAAFTWSGLVAFVHDYPVHRRQRASNYYAGQAALSVVPPDSLFVTAPFVDPFMRLIEQPGVRIAFPGLDAFRNFRELLQYHLKSGRRCFAAFPPNFWNQLRNGPLQSFRIAPVIEFPGATVAEISFPEKSNGEPPQK